MFVYVGPTVCSHDSMSLACCVAFTKTTDCKLVFFNPAIYPQKADLQNSNYQKSRRLASGVAKGPATWFGPQTLNDNGLTNLYCHYRKIIGKNIILGGNSLTIVTTEASLLSRLGSEWSAEI